ncbi:hypothetical protein ACFQY7_30930 [Actinomadura luteofluorescens]|uniref:Uncharacterized protein n=1 Tax=Actinomadura luteofluorescens TaxID=46163 RepID=A0A7Y9EL00_9ACTN|nr:hypothetical protein [Actinomadura luteofluorescens]NYD49713.1 hypothetical protein [Actinomadura luteofluorescens]
MIVPKGTSGDSAEEAAPVDPPLMSPEGSGANLASQAHANIDLRLSVGITVKVVAIITVTAVITIALVII